MRDEFLDAHVWGTRPTSRILPTEGEYTMTLFQFAVLVLLALNVCVTYYMLRRLAIATLTGSFAVAHWLNPRFARWFDQTHEKMLAQQHNDTEYEKLSTLLAEQNPDCERGRESVIATAFEAYRECRRIPAKYRNLDREP